MREQITPTAWERRMDEVIVSTACTDQERMRGHWGYWVTGRQEVRTNPEPLPQKAVRL